VSATPRDHFVYRAWDEFGLLLYVGCTKQPTVRWKQHKTSEQALWTQYAQRFLLSGPYERKTALRLEGEAIDGESPYFNCTSEQRRNDLDRRKMSRRLMKALRQRRPELFPCEVGSTEWDEYAHQHEQIEKQVDSAYPAITNQWRQATYLNDVRRLSRLADTA